MPGKLLNDGVNRRWAWSRRYAGVLIVALLVDMTLLSAVAAVTPTYISEKLDGCQVHFRAAWCKGRGVIKGE
jgi:hypothetical protein